MNILTKEEDLRQVAIERDLQFVLTQGERFFGQQSILMDYLTDCIQSFDVPHSYCDDVMQNGVKQQECFNRRGNVRVTYHCSAFA